MPHHDPLPFNPSDPTLPAPLRRLGRRLALFQGALEKALPAQTALLPSGIPVPLAHRLHLAAGRAPLFSLEALGRLERGKGKGAPKAAAAATLTALTAQTKRIEDALGAVDFWWAFAERAQGWGVPAKVLRWAHGHHLMACGGVESVLAHDGWVQEGVVGPQIASLGESLLAVKWPGAKRYRRHLVDTLEAILRHTHEASLGLDLSDVEGGLHEVRRKVRWISIYASALDGGVTLDDSAEPPAGWDHYLTPAVLNDRFARLPAADPSLRPVTLPAPLFYALSWLISSLGELKDRAQWTETLALGLAETGLEGEPKRWLGASALPHADVAPLATTLVKQTLIDDRLLVRLADAVAKQA